MISSKSHTWFSRRPLRLIATAVIAALSVTVLLPAQQASATGLGGVSMQTACSLQYAGQNRQAVVRDYHSAFSWACYNAAYGYGGINVTAECKHEYGYGAVAYYTDASSPWSWYCSWGITQQMRNAVAWAIAERNSPDPAWSDHWWHAWSGMCERFAEQAEGFAFQFPSAIDDYYWQRNTGRLHTTGTPPAGALVFYDGGGGYGHVAVSLGNGQEIGTLGLWGQRLPVSQYPVWGYLTNGYLGWAFPRGS